MQYELIIERINPKAILPRYSSAEASGLDLYACLDEPVLVFPTVVTVIPIGIKIDFPAGVEGQIRPRSGLSREGVAAILGTIDADYRGEIKVMLVNMGSEPYLVRPGDRIAQMVLAPVISVDVFEGLVNDYETERGSKGFGSTGL